MNHIPNHTLDRLRDELAAERETTTSLLRTIALIREAAGLGNQPMLSELPDAVKDIRQERDGYLVGNQQTLRALAEANEIAVRYKRERDEAQQDAQRYRWLKSKGCDWVTIYRHPSGDEIFDGKGDAKMDERIDAARTRDEEGGGA